MNDLFCYFDMAKLGTPITESSKKDLTISCNSVVYSCYLTTNGCIA